MNISKNAVVGKAHRLNLPARPSPIRREAVASAPAAPVQAVAAQGAPAVAAPASVPDTAEAPAPRPAPAAPAPALSTLPPATQPIVPPASLAAPRAPAPPRRAAPPTAVVRPFQRVGGRSCCWPIGEPGTPEFRFCTAEAINGKPYCPEHAAVAYVKARDRREDAA